MSGGPSTPPSPSPVNEQTNVTSYSITKDYHDSVLIAARDVISFSLKLFDVPADVIVKTLSKMREYAYLLPRDLFSPDDEVEVTSSPN